MIIPRILVSFLLAGTLFLLFSHPAGAQNKVKSNLAIMPFSLNGGGDLSYLKEGLRTMLASRIAAKARVAVIGRSEVKKVIGGKDEYDPSEVASTLGADLVLTGSITAIGSNISIDARLIRIATKDSESFFVVAENQNGIIGAIDQLASDVTANILGIDGQTSKVAQTASSPKSSSEPTISPDQSLHPDRMFKFPVPVPASAPVITSPIKVEVAKPNAGNSLMPVANVPLSATRSQFLEMEIQVMDVGDVFGEGGEQIVVAEKQKVTVFRQENNRLVKAGDIPAAPRHVRIIALNMADLNENGRAEIYISAISDNNPLSYAVEWDGRNFVKLFDKQRHYLRPMLIPGKGWALYGQQADFDGPAKSGIYKADRNKGSLLTDEKLVVLESANLFEFVMGDFTGDGLLETAVHTQEDDLLLYNNDGEILWKGSGNYGYTSRFIGPAYSGRLNEHKTLQIPTRLVAVDLNGDGRQELLAMANPTGMATLIKTVGSFVGGSIKVMGWNGVTFEKLWSTGEIGSYVASYQVKNAEPRLYITMISKKAGALFSSFLSVVASYSLVNVAR